MGANIFIFRLVGFEIYETKNGVDRRLAWFCLFVALESPDQSAFWQLHHFPRVRRALWEVNSEDAAVGHELFGEPIASGNLFILPHDGGTADRNPAISLLPSCLPRVCRTVAPRLILWHAKFSFEQQSIYAVWYLTELPRFFNAGTDSMWTDTQHNIRQFAGSAAKHRSVSSITALNTSMKSSAYLIWSMSLTSWGQLLLHYS